MQGSFPWLGVLAAVVGLSLGAVLARGARLRDRLFRRLVLMALLPTLAVSSLAVYGYSQSMRVLQAPGLSQPTEAGIELARQYLDQLEREAAAGLDRWREEARSSRAVLPDSVRVWSLGGQAAGAVRDRTRPERGVVPEGLLALAAPPSLPWTGRREVGGRIWILAAAAAPDSATVDWWGRPLPDRAVAALEGVREGSRGLQQLRLYYGSLLRQQGIVAAAALFLLILAVSFFLSHRLAARLARPLAELSTAMQGVAHGTREVEFSKATNDELGQLQSSFAEMVRALDESETRLRQTERLAAWRQVARRLAHEIKNPLTPIHLAIHRMRERSSEPAILEGLEIVREEARNLERLAEEFSTFARLPAPRRRPVEFGEVWMRVVKLYAPDRRLEGEAMSPGIEVLADEGQLSQVLSNLLKNAVEASGADAPVHQRWHLESEWLVFELEDEGPGVGPDAERIFEPDFTTKRAGTGLGLPICRRIASDHGAEVGLGRSRGSGACFRLRWPLVPAGEQDDS